MTPDPDGTQIHGSAPGRTMGNSLWFGRISRANHKAGFAPDPYCGGPRAGAGGRGTPPFSSFSRGRALRAGRRFTHFFASLVLIDI